MKQLSMFLVFISVFLPSLKSKAQQITETQVPLSLAKVVDFKEKADYEIVNPAKKKRRFVEQGEDKEDEFNFRPQAVPADAVHFDVPPVANSLRSSVNSPAPSVSFNGTLDNSTLIPPDIRGAAGPNHVMETTNQEFKIFTKTGALVSTLSISSFFSATGGNSYFDPHIVYDPTNGRYIICIAGDLANNHMGIFIGVSQTNNPTGLWYTYSFDGTGNTTDFLDYPLLGYNTNWVVITANDFLSSSVVGKIYVLNRASLYSGSVGTVTAYSDNNVFSLAPAQTYDPAENTEYMVENWNGNSNGNGFVRVGKITGTANAPAYTAGSLVGVNQPWSENYIDAAQSGSTQKIDAGDTRIGNSVYVNGSLWFCQTAFLPASSPTRSAAQWWQINPATPSVIQFGRVDDATSGTFNFYPGIAVNSSGDAFLGYCKSSSTTYASAAYSVRNSTDAAHTMQTGYVYKAGVASYYKTYGGSRNRWGDYTGASVDPTNNSFWNFNEWANTNNKWGTAIANVVTTPVVPCNAAIGTSTSNIADNTATFNWTAVSGATGYNIQHRASGASSWISGFSATNSYDASGLIAGTSYEWQVQTVCSGGTSAYTTATTFITTGIAPCNAPAALTTTLITTTTATFNWIAASGALGYNLLYRVIGSGSWLIGSTASNSYNAIALTPSSTYEWQVQTVCNSGNSEFTASATFTTATPTTCTDIYESNNTSGTSKIITTNTDLTGFITPATDVDWFKFSTVSPNVKVQVTLANLPADYDLVLYDSKLHQIAKSQNTGTANETVKKNAGGAATYFIKVNGFNGANNASQCYTLRASARSTSFAPEEATVEAASQKEDVIELEPVMRLYPNPATNELNVEFISAMEGKVRVNVYDLTGKKLINIVNAVSPGINSHKLNTSSLINGVYIFEIENNGETQRQEFTIAK